MTNKDVWQQNDLSVLFHSLARCSPVSCVLFHIFQDESLKSLLGWLARHQNVGKPVRKTPSWLPSYAPILATFMVDNNQFTPCFHYFSVLPEIFGSCLRHPQNIGELRTALAWGGGGFCGAAIEISGGWGVRYWDQSLVGGRATLGHRVSQWARSVKWGDAPRGGEQRVKSEVAPIWRGSGCGQLARPHWLPALMWLRHFEHFEIETRELWRGWCRVGATRCTPWLRSKWRKTPLCQTHSPPHNGSIWNVKIWAFFDVSSGFFVEIPPLCYDKTCKDRISFECFPRWNMRGRKVLCCWNSARPNGLMGANTNFERPTLTAKKAESWR